MTPTWELLHDLPLVIETVESETLRTDVGWVRKTTVVHLRGQRTEGVGEDVTYDAEEHGVRFPSLELAGVWTLGSLSAHLDTLDLFPHGAPGQHAYRDYRRWAVESAALDLALRQAGTTLGEVLGREVQPVTFVLSTRAGGLDEWVALYPSIRFKLDPTPDWPPALFGQLRTSGRVDVADLKGAYVGTVVDNPADPELYRRVLEELPDAWIEDPALTDETLPLLEPHAARVTWDAPIHAWADVAALPWKPRCLNSKPSRFGSLSRYFTFTDCCAREGIALYGGGQFELGPGRGHIQLLAALLHPDAPNDVAPSAYNAGGPRPGLPESPLRLVAGPGFRAV